MAQRAEEPETEMRWLAPSDLPALLQLDYDIYEKQLIGDDTLYTSWITKNTRTTLCIFDTYAELCLAYISMLPLQEQTILHVLQGERDELDLRADDILTLEQAGWYTLLISSVAAREERYFNRVLNGIFGFWLSHAPERKIKRMYAQAASEEGRALLKGFYFSELAITKNDGTLEPVKNAYYLDLQYPAQSRFFKRYQAVIRRREQRLGGYHERDRGKRDDGPGGNDHDYHL
jgi:hypothetical protein